MLTLPATAASFPGNACGIPSRLRLMALPEPLDQHHARVVAWLLFKDVARADAQPDDVRLAPADRDATSEEGATVGRPCHLQDAGRTLVSLDAQAGTESAHPRVGYKLATSRSEELLLFALFSSESFVVA